VTSSPWTDILPAAAVGGARRFSPSSQIRFASTSTGSPHGLVEGDREAVRISGCSRRIIGTSDAALVPTEAIPALALREAALGLPRSPAPTYQLRSPTPPGMETPFQDLLCGDPISAETTIDVVVPPVNDPGVAPRAFWSAPRNDCAAHHACPEIRVVHEWVAAAQVEAYMVAYGAAYWLVSATGELAWGVASAALLWHGSHKVVVFHWQGHGNLLGEESVAGGGVHHTLSGAEARARGMPQALIIAPLAACDPPITIPSGRCATELQTHAPYGRASRGTSRTQSIATTSSATTRRGGSSRRCGGPRRATDRPATTCGRVQPFPQRGRRRAPRQATLRSAPSRRTGSMNDVEVRPERARARGRCATGRPGAPPMGRREE
jgi:hypothetical protein